jgi:N-methylhydantoinase B
MGATSAKDGEHVLSWPSNISSTPVEVAERNSPLFFHHKRLRANSGGNGRQRGGLGQDMLIESGSKRPIVLSFMAERTKFSAPASRAGRRAGWATCGSTARRWTIAASTCSRRATASS